MPVGLYSDIKTHTKEKPPKIFNITFTILPFHQEKYPN